MFKYSYEATGLLVPHLEYNYASFAYVAYSQITEKLRLHLFLS